MRFMHSRPTTDMPQQSYAGSALFCTSYVEGMSPSEMMRAARLAAGVSQTELAERLGRNQASISRAERGDTDVTVPEYIAWMQALGLSVSFAPLPKDDAIGRLRTAFYSMGKDHQDTLLTLAELLPRIPMRILRGLILFAESQAQADTKVG